GGDVLARKLADVLSTEVGQRVIVDNVPGGNGVISVENVVKAPPDGYTFLIATAGVLAIQGAARKDLPYNAATDLAPVSTLSDQADVLAVNPKNISAKTLPEFIKLLKDSPGKYSLGVPGLGLNQHFEMELFQLKTDTKALIVSYKSGVEATT